MSYHSSIAVVLGRTKAYIGKLNAMAKKVEEVIRLADLLAFDRIRIALSEAIRLDTEADEYRREIVENYLPAVPDASIRESIRIFLRMVDHVGEWIKSCLRYLDLVPLMSIPTDARNSVISLFKLARSGIEVLESSIDMLEKARFEEAYSYGRKLEEIEEEADRVLHEAQKNIIRSASKLENVAYVVFLNEMVKSLEIATDYEEDAGDIVRSLSISLSRALKPQSPAP